MDQEILRVCVRVCVCVCVCVFAHCAQVVSINLSKASVFLYLTASLGISLPPDCDAGPFGLPCDAPLECIIPGHDP